MQSEDEQMNNHLNAIRLFLSLVWRVWDKQVPQRIDVKTAWAVAKQVWLTPPRPISRGQFILSMLGCSK
jgi:hypothetical protein